jgi:hypothetical protein
MSAVAVTYQQIATNDWRLSWTGTGPTFYVWRDSTLIVPGTTKKYYDVHMEPGEAATFTVFDSSASVPDYNQPCRGTIWWYATANTEQYRVEVYSGGQWITAITIPETGKAIYSYTTDILANETAHQYRVYSVGIDGNDSTPLTFSILAVRRADPPLWTYAWTKATSTLRITIAA